MTSDSLMPPTPRWMTLTVTSSWGRRAISSSTASSEPGDVGLEDEVELLDAPSRGELEDVLERDLAAGAPRDRLGLQAVGALAGELARGAVVLDHADELAGLGHAVEAEDLDRVARAGLLDLVAHEVVHGADAAPVGAGDERVADLERAALDEDRDHGAAARVELGLDDDARGLGLGVGLELLELGDDLDRVEQVVEALAWSWPRRRRTRSRRPTRRAGGRAGSSRCARASGRRPPCRSC